MAEKLRHNDHRVIGPKLNLYQQSELIGPGLPLFPWQGEVIIHELQNFLRDLLNKNDYKFVKTPHLAKIALFKKSGHWDNYRDDMFLTKSGNEKLAVKPMSCPFHTTIFKKESHSYKDLPIRYAEFATVYRNEASGALTGLSRVRMVSQDDAHIFCSVDTLNQELSELVGLVKHVYKVLGFKKIRVELSTRPKKYVGEIKTWNRAEEILTKVLKKNRMKFLINKGDGAFYGPKIDFHAEDANKKTWQLATIQLDFNLGPRLNATYINKADKKEHPIIIHRALLGSFERIFGILIEHYNGAFPTWLAPTQAKVISFNDELETYTKSIERRIRSAGIRVEGDYRSETVQAKVRDAEKQKVPYIIVIGGKEKANKTLAVRPRGSKPKFGVKMPDFLKRVKVEIKNRTI
jgi:threonyl-tRNA synthetase